MSFERLEPYVQNKSIYCKKSFLLLQKYYLGPIYKCLCRRSDRWYWKHLYHHSTCYSNSHEVRFSYHSRHHTQFTNAFWQFFFHRQFDVVDEVQLPCSKILVRLGSRPFNVQKVMETLLLKFQPGSASHFYVITTLSELATCNPTHVVPFLKAILTTMMANMKATKKDNLR